MRTIAGREFARIVERRGWQLLRIAGSHHILWQGRKHRPAFDPDSWQSAA